MDLDELEPTKLAKAMLTAEELEGLSIHELEQRIERLEAEIEVCRVAIDAKQNTKSAADKVFNL